MAARALLQTALGSLEGGAPVAEVQDILQLVREGGTPSSDRSSADCNSSRDATARVGFRPSSHSQDSDIGLGPARPSSARRRRRGSRRASDPSSCVESDPAVDVSGPVVEGSGNACLMDTPEAGLATPLAVKTAREAVSLQVPVRRGGLSAELRRVQVPVPSGRPLEGKAMGQEGEALTERSAAPRKAHKQRKGGLSMFLAGAPLLTQATHVLCPVLEGV